MIFNEYNEKIMEEMLKVNNDARQELAEILADLHLLFTYYEKKSKDLEMKLEQRRMDYDKGKGRIYYN